MLLGLELLQTKAPAKAAAAAPVAAAKDAAPAAKAGTAPTKAAPKPAPARTTLSEKCFVLADIAEPPNMKQAFESSLSFALLKSQLEKIESTTGVPLIQRDTRGAAQGISLTGWMAMLGMTALVVLVIFGAYAGYKRFRGIPDKDYTLVVKQKHPPTHE